MIWFPVGRDKEKSEALKNYQAFKTMGGNPPFSKGDRVDFKITA